MEEPDDPQSQSSHEWRRELARHCCGWSVVLQPCHARTEV